MSEFPTPTDAHASPLSRTGKYLIIATAFLGWFFGGTHMAINGLVMRTAALNLLVVAGEGELTDSDRATIATMRDRLDIDHDGIIETDAFVKSAAVAVGSGRVVSKADLMSVGLTKDPDTIKILGVAGDRDGVISDDELERYVVEARLGGRAGRWFGFYICAFLFGAALGGLVFGRIGDRYGRARGMAAAITCYSGMSLLAYF